MFIVGLLLIMAGIILFIYSHHKTESRAFFETSPLAMVFGVYYWGQGLVVAPFWILIGVLSLFLLFPLDLLRIYLLFHALRSSYEILYFLTHKPTDSIKPPFLGDLSENSIAEHVSLYQLSHLMLVVILTFLLINLV